ncbi:MAG: DUF1326 domain-containing protein [Pseudomonadota bacterium]
MARTATAKAAGGKKSPARAATAKSKAAAKRSGDEIQPWKITGELILNCNCTVFCPCVVSLGQHPPTEGTCKAWLGVRIDDGEMGDLSLGGLNVAMMMDIPGKMGDGNWTAAAYIDDRANEEQHAALEQIFSGRAKGTTGLFRLLVGEYLGAKPAPISFVTEGKVRHLQVGKMIQGAVEPIGGADSEKDLVVTNTEYWMGPDVIVARALKGKVRDFGRVWNFDGRSAEICEIEWSGP